jgi:hypothetical protein
MIGCAQKSLPVPPVSKYFLQYCELISSADHLELCRGAQSLGELLATIKTLWNCIQLSDDELLGEIARLNKTPITTDVRLAGKWLAYRYQPKTRLVNWLLPVGHAIEPFHDEYISRCRQLLFNQLIQPCCSLDVVRQQGEGCAAVQPAGFIFHLSRCGSTLVSGCLSELDSTCVFSESPLLTELLLDKNLSVIEQQCLLGTFINLQAAAFPDRPNMIIKWNAWDIFQWELIRGLYPQVPVIFLVRDPVEILASHQRLAGRHMAGDPGLAGVNPIFSFRKESLLAWRSKLVAALLGEMNQFIGDPLVMRVDYSDLDANRIREIGHHFSVFPTDGSLQKITWRLQFHSKTPDVAFTNDSHGKQTLFDAEDKSGILQLLLPLYARFFTE